MLYRTVCLLDVDDEVLSQLKKVSQKLCHQIQ